MNLTEANIRHGPARRSGAVLRRAPGKKESSRKSKSDLTPYKALKMQRALSAVSYTRRNSIKAMIKKTTNFENFPLLPVVQESITTQALRGMANVEPTPVQRLAIPALLNPKIEEGKGMQQFLIAAETGSGKTLAYLLPVLDAIKRAEAVDKEAEANKTALEEEQRKNRNPFELESPPLSNKPHPTTGRPRAIILVPTAELVNQVGRITKLLSHTIKFRSALISSSYTGKVIRNRLFAPTGVDIVITTPHLLSSVAESDPNVLSRVSHLVIDEADSLLDRSFAPSTSAIIDKTNPSLRKLILCSATIPRSLDSFLRKRFPNIRRLVTPKLHAIPRRVQLGVVDVMKDPYRGNKDLACADTIWSIGKAAAEHVIGSTPGTATFERVDLKRILVFVNEREKTEELADYLNKKGIQAAALNRDTLEHRQPVILDAFTSSGTQTVPISSTPNSIKPGKPNYIAATSSATPSRRHLPNTKVLVSTDLGSRGIDTLAVRHVILYDVPHSTIDFIHRLGRTGRMGRRGRGIVLVGRGDRRDVVSEVQDGMFRGQALI